MARLDGLQAAHVLALALPLLVQLGLLLLELGQRAVQRLQPRRRAAVRRLFWRQPAHTSSVPGRHNITDTGNHIPHGNTFARYACTWPASHICTQSKVLGCIQAWKSCTGLHMCHMCHCFTVVQQAPILSASSAWSAKHPLARVVHRLHALHRLHAWPEPMKGCRGMPAPTRNAS